MAAGIAIRLRRYVDGKPVASVEDVLAPRYRLNDVLQLVQGCVNGGYPILLLTASGATLPIDPAEWQAIAVFED